MSLRFMGFMFDDDDRVVVTASDHDRNTSNKYAVVLSWQTLKVHRNVIS